MTSYKVGKYADAIIPVGIGAIGVGSIYAAWAFSKWVGVAILSDVGDTIKKGWGWANDIIDTSTQGWQDLADDWVAISKLTPKDFGLGRRPPMQDTIDAFEERVELQRASLMEDRAYYNKIGCQLTPWAPNIGNDCRMLDDRITETEDFINTAAQWRGKNYGALGYGSSSNENLISKLKSFQRKGYGGFPRTQGAVWE